MATSAEDGPLFLGFDLSTQQLKAVIIDDTSKVRHEATVHYDSELPEFRTHGGVVMSKHKIPEISASPGMWLKALDLLLERLRVGWGPEEMFGRVMGVSGAAQQHGTVYWAKGSSNTLANIDSTAFLHTQLASCFSIPQSPVWRDDSTAAQCAKIAEAMEGDENLAKITGSAAHKRFSSAQICKIAESKPQNYANTERISLVSSFLCSILLGRHADIDWSDGSGMNLLDIQAKQWHPQCLQACAPGLEEKLGQPCSPCSIQGKISTYFVDRFGFNPDCQVVTFTGDNPSSLAGLGLGPHELALSLGSSDTLFAWVPEYLTLPGGLGHLLCNPVNPQHYMALLCFTNGSLTRERIRNRVADRSWEKFSTLLDSTPRGNFGNLAIFLDAAEPLMPGVSPGDHRFNAANVDVTHYTSAEIEVRALVEGQALATRAALETQLEYKTDADTRLTATGGASTNQTILQVYADVFNAPVFVQEGSNSAALGGALRALHVITRPDEPYSVVTQVMRDQQKPLCTPYQDAQQIYDPMLQRWKDLVQQLAANSKTN